MTTAYPACPISLLPHSKLAVRQPSRSVTNMDAVDVATVHSAAPELPLEGPISASAPSTDVPASKIDMNGHREVPMKVTTNGSLLPENSKERHEPGLDVEDANSQVSVMPNSLTSNGNTADAVHENSDGNSNFTPVPLTNGHQEQPAIATSTIKNDLFDEIWSPATKLKCRLEDTKDLIVCPGVYDGFSARIALSVGFDAMYMVLPRFLIVF